MRAINDIINAPHLFRKASVAKYMAKVRNEKY